MSASLKHLKRTLLVGELQAVLAELRAFRSGRVSESEMSSRAASLAQRVELARGKLDDLKSLQRKEKAVQARRRQIAQDNARRD
jgi:hypothetical protein